MITDIFTQLGDIVDAFGTFLTSMFNHVIGLFYVTPNPDMQITGGITPLGTFMLLGLGTGLLIWGFGFIRSLIRVKTK